ncbi:MULTISPECIES: hypothetical protein [unclassified Streptomyces]|uniref:hypothetical protein n=1 Tax=unclassified Streptomyces TaxID=2593676 RepID=UPI000B833671|nr:MULTISPECIES: hypothetical protein [unclassified Streptomyces]MYS24701.1 hypothetical protein [Streptomyces sp. SID4948]
MLPQSVSSTEATPPTAPDGRSANWAVGVGECQLSIRLGVKAKSLADSTASEVTCTAGSVSPVYACVTPELLVRSTSLTVQSPSGRPAGSGTVTEQLRTSCCSQSMYPQPW